MMQIVLVGADLEENLGIGMIAAVAEAAGHRVSVVAFNEEGERGSVLARVLSQKPALVGLSIQFQHRSTEFLGLAEDLRASGYRGHLTAGGQYPTLAWREVLAGAHGLSSIVLHDGEETFVELLRALETGAPLEEVAGLALPLTDGVPVRTRGRRLVDDLDRLPFPHRYRAHSRHLGIPFVPIMSGRGCWGRCSYCSITSFYRDARRHGGGRMLRYRSPANVAAEMAEVLRRAGPRAVFCFHDDSFLLPRPEASLRRLRDIREALDRRGPSSIGLIGKCRPDSLTPALAKQLAELGVVRLYLGVENTSEPGLEHLGRGIRREEVRSALLACRAADIFVCYNLLVFEPEATLDDLAENLAFIREHADHPVNFGRAEPYFGTPLQLKLAGERGLSGDYLGHGYRVKDDRTELLFRICAAVFRQRNYDADGVHNRVMGVGYAAKLLQHFFGSTGRHAAIRTEAAELTREVVLESAGLLEEALSMARTVDLDDRDRIERETALLGLRVAAADGRRHAQLDRFYERAERLACEEGAPRLARAAGAVARRAAQVFQGVALASLLAGCDDRPVAIDPDVGPLDGRIHGDADAGPLDRPMVVDPDVRPLDRAREMVVDPDVRPLDHAKPRDAGPEVMIVDPPPPPDARVPQARLIDQWRDPATGRQITRSMDLPLFDAPSLGLTATRDTEPGILIQAVGIPSAVSLRWEGDGEIVGSGPSVRWLPADDTDQIRVAARSRGGIGVAALRAKDVPTRRG